MKSRPPKLSKLYWLNYTRGGKWSYDHKKTWTCDDGRTVVKTEIPGQRDTHILTKIDGTTEILTDLD